MAKRQRRMRFEQRTFDRLMWGGLRPGAGRKKQKGSGVPHDAREEFPERVPVHVTMKLKGGLPSLRRKRELAVLRECFRKGREKAGFRLVHFSVQSNHLHLIVEAAGKERLAPGVQGLAVRIAKGLNRLWGRKGRLFSDRYHSELLKTPRQVRNALRYVLDNARHHDVLLLPRELDPFSSADQHRGWSDDPLPSRMPPALGLVVRARSWLLNVGWRRHGPLPLPI